MLDHLVNHVGVTTLACGVLYGVVDDGCLFVCACVSVCAVRCE